MRAQLRLALGLPAPPRRPPPVQCSLQGPRRLIAYLTGGSQGWILEFLWRDLVASAVWSEQDAPELLVASDRDSLAAAMDGANALVVVMFQGHLQRLLRDGIPAERVILYFSHARIGLALPDLNRLHSVLFLNGQDHAMLRIAGVQPQRLHWFPAGYDPVKFFPGPPLHQRPIDVLFVGRYVAQTNLGYHERKRYVLLCELVRLLSEQRLRVVLLGRGWQACEYALPAAVETIDVAHSAYGAFYRQARLVCSVSAKEGGPVSFLEGLASGCLMLSVATGFAADFACGFDGIWHLPLSATAEQWCEHIQHCLPIGHADPVLATGDVSPGRQVYLRHAQFDQLALQLRQLWDQPVASGSGEQSRG
ncbi:MAG: glycosyltransferase [Synechococcus sp.]